MGTSLTTSRLGLSQGRTLSLVVKDSMSLPLSPVATLTPPLPCDFKSCWQKGSDRARLGKPQDRGPGKGRSVQHRRSPLSP